MTLIVGTRKLVFNFLHQMKFLIASDCSHMAIIDCYKLRLIIVTIVYKFYQAIKTMRSIDVM